MRLPDEITADDLLIRRWREEDAPALGAAITANIEHLRPRMAWIAFEPQTVEQRRERIAGWHALSDQGEFVAGIWEAGELLGTIGVHGDRGWPDGPEIGYWLIAAAEGRGIMTRVTTAVIDVLFTDPGLAAVYLANDVTNRASRRIPEKLGFTHLGTFDITIAGRALAPADTGTDDHWRLTREAWSSRPR